MLYGADSTHQIGFSLCKQGRHWLAYIVWSEMHKLHFEMQIRPDYHLLNGVWNQ